MTSAVSAENASRTWDNVLALDVEALSVFSSKGRGAPGVPVVPRELNGNSIKLRRVLQLTRDLSNKPAGKLRILDLGCGDGVYSIEAASKGAEVLGVDGRDVRMQNGVACAERHGLSNVTFIKDDVRSLNRGAHGEFDVIFNLGILYHLDVPDIFTWMESLYDMLKPGGFMIVDTHICPRSPIDTSEYRGRKYEGMRTREHEDNVPMEQRKNETFRSLDNTYNFLFSRNALVRLLTDTGFTSVMEVHAPLEIGKRADRVTFVATKGTPIKLATYPLINDKSENQIAEALNPKTPSGNEPAVSGGGKEKSLPKRAINWFLRKFGYEIRKAS
jgi:SAM-dependent methyltransferase